MGSRSDEARPALRVFCSYAREDDRFRKDLEDNLRHLQLQRIITWWDDRRIESGQHWDGVIKDSLDKADVVVFLVSYYLLGSQYVYDVEVERAFKRHREEGVAIIPIVVRDVDDDDFEATPFAGLQGIPTDAKGLKPIERWKYQSSAYKLVSRTLRRIATEMGRIADAQARHAGPSVRRAARVWDVPHRDPALVGRADLVASLASEFAADAPRPVVALVGQGGVGKTSVAAEYCWQRQHDYDLIAWLHADQDTRLGWEYARLADRVGLPANDMETAKTRFREWLATTQDRWLLVFDNAVEPDAVRALLPETMQGHALVTSRDPVWSSLAREVRVDPLAQEQAVEYLLSRTGSRDTAAATQLAAMLEGLPLSLKIAASTVQEDRISLADYLNRRRAGSRR